MSLPPRKVRECYAYSIDENPYLGSQNWFLAVKSCHGGTTIKCRGPNIAELKRQTYLFPNVSFSVVYQLFLAEVS